jgi:glycosyltransferase involved in cell wall biosynthesis
MRICWLSVSDQLGGSEMALLTMLEGLRAMRPDWTHRVVLPGAGPLRERIEAAGATCSVAPMPPALAHVGEASAVRDRWNPAATIAFGLRLGATAVTLRRYEMLLSRTIAEFQPDLVHTNGLKAHVIAARVRPPHVKVVWHLHEYVSQRRVTAWLLRRYARQCDAIAANSASVAADVARLLESPPPVHVVRNAVDLQVFCPEGPALDLDDLAGLPAAAPDVVRVGLVATFARWKGHEVFLDALQRISASRSIRGYIVGGALYDTAGSQFTRRELEAMIDARNLRSRVGLTGFVDSAAAMRALDVVVHASVEREPFGLVIAEAMACGRAVITTAHGGAAEIIEADRDAVVAPAGDSRALATAIDRLAADRALRRSIGDAARTAALVRFAPQRMAEELAHVFESATDRRALARSA